MKGKKRITPTTLKKTCAIATRLASVWLPMELAKAVTHVPTLAPRITGMAAASGMSPGAQG